MNALPRQHPNRPGLSVVVPTTGGRPELLNRAIKSCLLAAANAQVEVIVVFNGGADVEASGVPADDSVKSLVIEEQGANPARNAGLEASTGRFVRFLDDDDFLEPKGASDQYARMMATDAEVSTGGIEFIDEMGLSTGLYVPTGTDLTAELFQHRPSTLPVAHLFRRDFLADARWDPGRSYLQDVDWMHGLLRRSEVRWLPYDGVVGSWYRHTGARTSADAARRLGEEALRMGAAIIEDSIDALATQGRLDAARRRAGAKALWDYAHQGFSYSPGWWTRVARKARTLDPHSKPGSPLFAHQPIRGLDPIVTEWLLYPVRAVARRVSG